MTSSSGLRGSADSAEHGASDPPSPAHRVTFNEDEYTKITTPRQDVLFKKGYLGRRRTQNPTETPEAQSTADSVESSEYLAEEQAQYFPPPGGFIDQNGVFYVNGGSYEVYDPYTGSLTVVVGPGAPYPPQAPLLAAMPCQPVPLAPLEWFNPPAGSYMCPAYLNSTSRKKRYSTDSQNCSAQSSESTGPPGSPQEPTDMMEMGGAGGPPMFPPQPPPYMYPGYMFGAPIYPMNGVSVQGVMPQCSPVPPPDMSTTVVAKRRKKRRRKRRGGATDEGSESSCEEVIGCDNAACSQSGASSDAGGQGSSCSKTNSDSGINTEPTPDSGSNTPPLPCDPQTLHLHHHHSPCESLPDEEKDKEELVSSCTSTPEAQKRTFESLPASDAEETLQELSCSSEPPPQNEARFTGCPPELAAIDNMAATGDHVTIVTSSSGAANLEDETVSDSVTSHSSVVDNCLPQPEMSQLTLEETAPVLSPESQHVEIVHLPGVMCLQDNAQHTPVGEVSEEELPPHVTDDDNNKESRTDLVNNDKEIEDRIDVDIVVVEQEAENRLEVVEEVEKMKEITTIEVVGEGEESNEIRIEVVVEEEEKNCDVKENVEEEDDDEEVSDPISLIEDNILMSFDMECPKIVSEEELKQIESEFDSCLSRFLKIQELVPPKPPPRRKRALNRVADKVAAKVVDAAIEEAVVEAAARKSTATVCNQRLPITEAVTKWLQSQGGSVLSVASDEDSDEVDEGIEDGESSTNQKNVEGNPFLAPYLSGSRTRVADADDCVSLVSSAGEWDMYQEHQERTRAICDPATSVDKYYRLGADDADTSASSPAMIKTAVHIRRAGPFPCGVCCIIQ